MDVGLDFITSMFFRFFLVTRNANSVDSDQTIAIRVYTSCLYSFYETLDING